MKSILLAALLATSSPETIVLPTDAGIFVVQPATVRVYENVNKTMQVDMVVDLSTATGLSRSRVGVSGCADGRGHIARVTEEGAPIVAPYSWALGGQKIFDVLATVICQAAIPKAQQPLPGARMT